VRRGAIILVACLGTAALTRGEEVTRAELLRHLYARATNQFSAALFLKPVGLTNTDISFQLAPLIIQEVADDRGSRTSPGKRSVPAPAFPRVVFYTSDSVQVNGRPHPRFSYQWFYPTENTPGRPTALRNQGVRITLDERGQPAIWEVLADTSGLRLTFVSQKLEAAAAAEYGKPLPGRRHSIERGLAQAPNAIVPGVLDDGPEAMGPILYLSEGTRDVSTLICRCMPAQVKRLTATRTFDLSRLESAPKSAFLGAGTNTPPVLWPADDRVENRLDYSLRLPAGF
jgi:hypothetical protein